MAVIDIGSNSGRVVVYQTNAEGYLRILASSRASLRLVRELDKTQRLSGDAERLALDALRDFKAITLGAGASRVVALATAAVRDASNGPEFIRRVRKELAIPVRILSGEEEARYGFLGAVRGLPVSTGVLFDLGGGSLQLSRFRLRRLLRTWSFPLGALRMSDAFLRSDPPSRSEQRRLKQHVRRKLERAGVAALARGEEVIGTGGTVRNLARIDGRARHYPLSRLHGYVLTRNSLDDVSQLVATRRLKKRASIPGLNDDRGDSIVGGSLVIQTLMEVLEARHLYVSGQGVREGVAYSSLSPDMPPPAVVRETAIAALTASFREWDADWSRRRAAVAAALIAALDPAASGELREALGHAARVLDIGRSIDFFDRHEHVADIVLATDLDGFSHREIALLSAIVRSAGDKETNPRSYAPLLGRHDRPAVERGAVLLALADDVVERCPRGTPVSVRCRVGKRDVTVSVRGLAGWRPRKIGPRFAEAFGRVLTVRASRVTRKSQVRRGK